MSRWLFKAVLVSLPTSAFAIDTTVTWEPSADTNVSSYTLYYGTSSRNYTQAIQVQNNQAVVTGLAQGTNYFFAAKSNDANGNQSGYSTEATIAGYSATPGTRLKFRTVSPTNTDQINYTLGSGSPAGATIDPASGVISWTPGYSDADSTNTISVTVSDVTTPSASRQMAMVVAISDYLVLGLPSVPAQPGQNVSLPLVVAGSDGAISVSCTIPWPAQSLQTPTLASFWPITGTLTQNGNSLSIELHNVYGYNIPTNVPIANLNFSVAPGLDSQFINLPITSFSATKASGASFANPVTQSGEVVVVGSSPRLRPTINNGTRSLTLYCDPAYSYEVDCATNLTPPIQWNVVQEYSPTNLQQTLPADPSQPVIFYRINQI